MQGMKILSSEQNGRSTAAKNSRPLKVVPAAVLCGFEIAGFPAVKDIGATLSIADATAPTVDPAAVIIAAARARAASKASAQRTDVETGGAPGLLNVGRRIGRAGSRRHRGLSRRRDQQHSASPDEDGQRTACKCT
jgi:hypothetical protein